MTLLTPRQSHFLDVFFENPISRDFFLSGGTALAEFYLKHRLSQDLDLFTVNPEVKFDAVNAEIQKIIRGENGQVEDQVTSDTFLRYIFRTGDDLLKIDLVKDVPIHFGQLKSFGNLKVDSLENIAAGKLLALFGRADAKDFIDLYFLWEKEGLIGYQQTLNLAKQKDLGLQEFYLASMLAQIERTKMFPETLKEYDREEMVRYFLDLTQKILRRLKPAE